jgi:hypothetical protein
MASTTFSLSLSAEVSIPRKRITIFFHDHDILRYIYQTTSQVTRIGCFQGRIGQTFTGTVSRDKVLQYGKPSTKLERIGFSMTAPPVSPDFRGFAINPRKTAQAA